MKRLFPKLDLWTIEEDRDECSRDVEGNEWPIYQIYIINQERELVAIGEYVAELVDAYQSLLNVLKDAESMFKAPYFGATPLSWSMISQYPGMRCSCCRELRPCLSSANEWKRELERLES